MEGGNRSAGGALRRHAAPKAASHNQVRRVMLIRFSHAAQRGGATIRVMGKFKPARGKKAKTARPPAALPCVVLVLLGMVLVMLFLYIVMRNANG